MKGQLKENKKLKAFGVWEASFLHEMTLYVTHAGEDKLEVGLAMQENNLLL